MPATEQTWRDQKQMHRIFAVTSVLMLIATLWMFGQDHGREWKGYQKKSRSIAIAMDDWRQVQYESEEVEKKRKAYEDELKAIRSTSVPAEIVSRFRKVILDHHTGPEGEVDESQVETLDEAVAEEEGARQAVLAAMEDAVRDAKFREDLALTERKFKSANVDAVRASLGLLVGKERPQPELDQRQREVDEAVRILEDRSLKYEAASDYRRKLDKVLAEAKAPEADLQKKIAETKADAERLRKANEDRRSNYIEFSGVIPLPGKKWLELPILDAFNSPLKIDNRWSDGLVQDYNFSKVRRFDRCTTCHQAISKTLPGTADVAAFVDEREVKVVLNPSADAVPGESLEETILNVFGIKLATEGLLARDDVTISYVIPKSAGARAALLAGDSELMLGQELRESLMVPSRQSSGGVESGLAVGDVITYIGEDKVLDRQRALLRLRDAYEAGVTVSLTVRRGLPHPYNSHPRLDLFVGSLSPHKVSDFACTICHDGQGGATAFRWASHTPDTPDARKRWADEHGWFDNHHWIYPMYPKRFAESSCLKCHHEVVDLQPSERFPDAPAPKVVHGYNLIRKYGCFGCHEINGFDGKDRVGPDLRLEPPVFAAAAELQIDPGFDKLADDAQDWAVQLVQHPERTAVRHRLLEALNQDAKAEKPVLSSYTHQKLVPLFKDVESPGNLRKPGPSLRYVGHKLDAEFMFDWIRDPKQFRPTTRMPQFFGHSKHLQAETNRLAKEAAAEISFDQSVRSNEKLSQLAESVANTTTDGNRHALHQAISESNVSDHVRTLAAGLVDDGEQFEPVEVLGMVTYLLGRTQEFEYIAPVEGAAEPDVERGRVAFQERGCLACHKHKEFADANKYATKDYIPQGPDLSGLGDKFSTDRNENGRKWLYSWIKQPTHYHVRTVMPDLFLDPISSQGADKKTIVTDPVADIVEFLLASKTGWSPAEGTLTGPAAVDESALNGLLMEHLKDAFFVEAASRYLERGIPAQMTGELKGAEKELVVEDAAFDSGTPLSNAQKLRYIGRKSLAKYGCFGCHDIPGFEDAKPIGTTLADWGRKDPSKLAFEHITQYLHHGEHDAEDNGQADHGAGHHDGDARHDGEGGHGEAESSDEMPEFYSHAIHSGHRSGFIYQKLREPRSYDYHKTTNKKFNERLRMPQFPFDDEMREAVVTFVLGLVADPPPEKYIYQPSPRSEALMNGAKVLEKYNCAGCHVLKPEQWDIAFEPGAYDEQAAKPNFPYIPHHFSSSELASSAEANRQNLLHAKLVGMPILEDSGWPRVFDPDGDLIEDDEEYDPSKVEYSFQLWEPVALNGHAYQVGEVAVSVPAQSIVKKYESNGGYLAKYLLPWVVKRERDGGNVNAKGSEAWAWLPPPLVQQGNKVQADWLHDFLLDPHPIRPAVVLRMPRFNMTSAEATALVNYFAARDNAKFPYDFDDRRRTSHLAEAARQYEGDEEGERKRLDDAMGLVVNYCVKCHIVADFEPAGSDRAKAPDLSMVYRRLRAGYSRNWIAKPTSILPYTAMPVNIPYDPSKDHLGGVKQELFHGTSIEQVDGLVDLLMNFDEYSRRKNSVASLVPKTKEGDPPAADGQDEKPAVSDDDSPKE